jgi:CMP-2-keto-3-deoxyoctulosonic acid synthetase
MRGSSKNLFNATAQRKFQTPPLEAAEKLEQLRSLENGIQIAVVQVAFDSVGVDAPEAGEWVERYLKKP